MCDNEKNAIIAKTNEKYEKQKENVVEESLAGEKNEGLNPTYT